MYQLHTTEAFVLTPYPHGESNRVYKLLTRERGLVYVHGRGVRDITNRNRYALATHAHATVTMVRGKGSWRLTGAHAHASAGNVAWRNVVMLSGRLLAQDDPHPEVFDVLAAMRYAPGTLSSEQQTTLEALAVVRVLAALGYVARPRASVVDDVLATDMPLVTQALHYGGKRTMLVQAANEAVQAAHA